MAFKRLTEEELAFLSEEQQARYLDELSIHEQREAFVRQLEAYETVELPEYRPVLNPIKVPAQVIAPAFSLPKTEVSVPETAVFQGELILPKLSGEPVIVTDIPSVSVTTVDVRSPEFDNPQPVVPKLTIPAAHTYKYQPPVLEEVSIAAPLSVAVEIPKLGSFEMRDAVVPTVSVAALPNLPKPTDIAQLVAQTTEAIPAIEVRPVNVRRPVMPKAEISELPTLDIDKQLSAPTIKLPKIEALNIPTVAVSSQPPIPSFKAPAVAAPEMPKVTAEPTEVKRICMPSTEVAALPQIKIAALPQLPRMSMKPEDLIRPSPEIHLPDLAEIAAISRSERSFPDVKVAVSAPKVPSISTGEIKINPLDTVTVPRLSVQTPDIPVTRIATQTPAKPTIPKVSVPASGVSIKKVKMKSLGEITVPRLSVEAPAGIWEKAFETLKLIAGGVSHEE